MKKITGIIFALFIFILFAVKESHANGTPGIIGEVILLEGKAELFSFISGERFTIDEGTKIQIGQTIRTSENTLLKIVLSDTTSLSLRESTSLAFYYLRNNNNDPPTRLKMEFGKLSIIQKKKYPNKTLELITPSAEISVVTAEFSVIAAETECLVLVHSGRVGLASSSISIKEAYIGTKGEEIQIKQNRAPSPPIIVPKNQWDSWLEQFIVTDRFRLIVRKNKDREIIDWIMRERNADD
ncbi:MAG TPA: FecR family protein [Spirochaetota bacterium]|nr:FecR family protein [Spirochaetota bacterium]HPI89626.1 FecR family protein [Spirochaetota bacterium]HPR49205.1 FecR family protein [Spirochaetota bacterium]